MCKVCAVVNSDQLTRLTKDARYLASVGDRELDQLCQVDTRPSPDLA